MNYLLVMQNSGSFASFRLLSHMRRECTFIAEAELCLWHSMCFMHSAGDDYLDIIAK